MRFVGPIIHLEEGHYLNWIKQVQLRQPASLSPTLSRQAAQARVTQLGARIDIVRGAECEIRDMHTYTHNKSVTKPVKMSLRFSA